MLPVVTVKLSIPEEQGHGAMAARTRSKSKSVWELPLLVSPRWRIRPNDVRLKSDISGEDDSIDCMAPSRGPPVLISAHVTQSQKHVPRGSRSSNLYKGLRETLYLAHGRQESSPLGCVLL